MSRTDVILAEIARDGSTRESIAKQYRLGIMNCMEQNAMDFIDWPTVNRALLKRYSQSGLIHIKRLAWSRKVLS